MRLGWGQGRRGREGGEGEERRGEKEEECY